MRYENVKVRKFSMFELKASDFKPNMTFSYESNFSSIPVLMDKLTPNIERISVLISS